jgi:hypothetical protein
MLCGRGGKAIRDDIEKTEEELRADQQHLATVDEQLLECQRIMKTIQPAVCLSVSFSFSLSLSFSCVMFFPVITSNILVWYKFKNESKNRVKLISYYKLIGRPIYESSKGGDIVSSGSYGALAALC